MDIFMCVYESAGHVMAVFDEGMAILGEEPAEILWDCRVCGRQGRGAIHWDEAPPRPVCWAVLDSLCCPKPCLGVEVWGMVSEYPACIRFELSPVHHEGHDPVYHEGWVRVAQINYIFAQLAEHAKSRNAGNTLLPF